MVLASCSKISGSLPPLPESSRLAPLETVTFTRPFGALSTARVRTSSTLEMSLGWGRNRGLHPQSRFAVSTQQSIHATFLTFASVSPLGSGIDPAV